MRLEPEPKVGKFKRKRKWQIGCLFILRQAPLGLRIRDYCAWKKKIQKRQVGNQQWSLVETNSRDAFKKEEVTAVGSGLECWSPAPKQLPQRKGTVGTGKQRMTNLTSKGWWQWRTRPTEWTLTLQWLTQCRQVVWVWELELLYFGKPLSPEKASVLSEVSPLMGRSLECPVAMRKLLQVEGLFRLGWGSQEIESVYDLRTSSLASLLFF